MNKSYIDLFRKEAPHDYKRMGSELGSGHTPSTVQEDDENLRGPDIEDVAVHRYDKITYS